MGRLLLMGVPIVISIYALVDVITTPARRIRALPKLLWMAIVVLLSLVGVGLWFWLGRPRRTTAFTVGSRTHTVGPDDDPDFLRSLRQPRRPQ